MCTLTYFPKPNGGFILTSNRDEAANRPTASPLLYRYNNVSALYPKDEVAGGTWIAAGDNKRVVSLLNGGFSAHTPKPPYRKSRGLVVKDILFTADLDQTLDQYELYDIEPFTLVIIEWNTNLRIVELVWDGSQRHIYYRDGEATIWSSSLLYDQHMKAERKRWFEDFIMAFPHPEAEAILEFHRNAGSDNSEYGLIMDRDFVRTKSITQVIVGKDLRMDYREIGSQSKTDKRLELN